MSGVRRVVVDFEMTDIDVRRGHRIAEVAAIETIDDVPTGRVFHSFVNPERPVTPEASAVNGLTDEFLADKPKFAEIAQGLHDFIGDSEIVFHCRTDPDGYCPDSAFLNAEMQWAGFEAYTDEQLTNTRLWAEAMFGDENRAASLNRVMDHYGVDHSDRAAHTGHGGLKDALYLAKVYPLLRADWQRFNTPPPSITISLAP